MTKIRRLVKHGSTLHANDKSTRLSIKKIIPTRHCIDTHHPHFMQVITSETASITM